MIAQKTDTTAPSARKSHIGIVYSILMVLLLLVLFLLSPANKVYASVVLTAVLVIATGLFGRDDYCSAFATPFHAPLLQRSMADCHTLTI